MLRGFFVFLLIKYFTICSGGHGIIELLFDNMSVFFQIIENGMDLL